MKSKIDIGISEADRKNVAHCLSKLLADSYTLYLKTHNFHWNVEGPMFQTLHVMFMGQYTELWNALDLIAERIRALGHYAPGSYSEFVKLSSIKEHKGVPKALKMVEELIEGHEAAIKTIRTAFPQAEEAKDQTTMDVLTQRLDIHEKTAWMLRSLLK
ncbi:MAG: DNA starvation/stationary phase protection protein [Bdellovibrio sp.]|nr:DNA starvation/stationary phase protection protein [Bdellovibrio sp.]